MTKQTPIALAINVLQALPAVIIAGEETIQLIHSTVATLQVMQAQNRDPSPSEWAAIDAQLATLTAELEEPEGTDATTDAAQPLADPLPGADAAGPTDPALVAGGEATPPLSAPVEGGPTQEAQS